MSYSLEFINCLVAQHTDLARRDLLADGLPTELSQSGVALTQEQQLAHALAFQRLLRGGCGPKQAKMLLLEGIDSASRIAAMTTEDLISHLTPSEPKAGETPTLAETADTGEAGIETIRQTSAVRHTQMVLRYLEELQESEPCLAATRFQGRPGWSPDTLTLPVAGTVDTSARSAPDSLALLATDTKVPPGRYSAFSPVAYFHALRTLQKKHLQGGSGEFAFEQRRPDVDALFGTGDEPHADDPIPYLEQVNRVLEAKLKAKLEKPPFEQLAEARYPFNLPFDLPRTRIRHCLDSFATDLATLYRTFAKEADSANATREMLGWSLDEFNCITVEKNKRKIKPEDPDDLGDLRECWGLKREERTNDPAEDVLAPLKEFLPRSGLTLETLQELLFQNLHPEEKATGIAAGFFINATTDSNKDYLDVDQSTLIVRSSSGGKLDLKHLDRIHRFLRTARRLGWTYAELDGVLASSCGNTLNDKGAVILAGVRYLQSRLNVPLDILCGLWSLPRASGMGNKPVFRFDDLFNRTFNNALARDYAGYILPKQDEDIQKLYKTLYNPVPEYKVNSRYEARLAAAFGLDKTDIKRIESHLKEKGLIAKEFPGQFDDKTPDKNPSFNPFDLAQFYRFARLPRILGLSVEDFLGLMELLDGDTIFPHYNPFLTVAGIGPGDICDAHNILGHGDILTVLWLVDLLANIADWLKAEGLSVPILRYLCKGIPSPSVQPAVSAAQLEQLANTLRQKFQPLLVTPQAIAPVVKPPETAEQCWNRLVLAERVIDERCIVLKLFPAPTPGTGETDLWRQINSLAERQAQALFAALGEMFAIPEELTLATGLAACRLADDGWQQEYGRQQFVALLLAPLLPPVLPDSEKPAPEGWQTGKAQAFWSHWQRLVTMIRLLGLGGAEAAAIFLHRDRFRISGFDTTSLSVAHLKTCTDLRRCAASLGQPNQPLIGFIKITEKTKIAPELAAITGWPKENIEILRQQVFQSPDAVDFRDILRLETCFRLAQRLGMAPSTLLDKVFKPLWGANGTAYGDFKAREQVAALVLGLLKGKAGPDAQAEVESALERALHRDKRDPLAGYVLHLLSSKLPAATQRGLYHHLLIDVEMGEEAMTSRLAEAINCLQLYIDRCRMGLEKGVSVAPVLEKAWPMLKSYRLWEAWQRLFLYPENYIAPELRDGRSPQFQTLEQRLQQSDIDDANVEAAFREYLDSFSELANLKIDGACAYQDPASTNDKDRCLALFGHTHAEPRRFYYRLATFAGNSPSVLCEPWEEVHLEPGVERVFPIQAFGKLFVFWATLKQEKSGNGSSASYKNIASLRYVFLNANSGWSQPQTLADGLDLGFRGEPEWPDEWNAPFPVFDSERNYLYLFYCGTVHEDRVHYRYLCRLTSELGVQLSIGGSHPLVWRENQLPKVGGTAVLTNGETIIKNRHSVVNQPDWLLFQTPTGVSLIKPNKTVATLSNVVLTEQTRSITIADITTHSMKCTKCYLAGGNITKSLSNRFTIEAWIRPNNLTDFQTIISVEIRPPNDSGNHHMAFGIFLDGKYIKILGNSRNEIIKTELASTTDGQHWFHIALTTTEKGDINTIKTRLYINGRLKAGITGNLSLSIARTHEHRLIIAHTLPNVMANSSDLPIHWFVGGLAEVRLWKTELDDKAIQANMQKRLAPKDHPDLIAYWPLSDGNGYPANRAVNLVSGEAHPIINYNSYGYNPTVWDKIECGMIFNSSPSNYYSTSYSESPDGFDLFRLTSNSPSTLSHTLFVGGIAELLSIKTQLTKELPTFIANTSGAVPSSDNILYESKHVRAVPPRIHLDFYGPNGVYYWELFFHAPFMLATRLNTAQQCEEARRWQQFIFNPTVQDSPWRFLPLWQKLWQKIRADEKHLKLSACEWKQETLPAKLGSRPTLYFDRSKNAKGTCDKTISLNNQEFTIEFWAKIGNFDQPRLAIIGHGKDKKPSEFLHITFEKNNNKYQLRFGLFNNDLLSQEQEKSKFEGWHHWACVYEKTQKRIYFNGEKVDGEKVGSNSGDEYKGGNKEFVIGHTSFDNIYYTGHLAEVRVWSRARTAQEIKEKMGIPLTEREPGLLCYWPMDEGKEETAYNYIWVAKYLQQLNHEASNLAAFRANPQDPHILARQRLVPYAKNVIMRYIDNLLDQGDALFRQYTQESITEAMLYYILADGLLGPKPRNIQPPAPKVQTLENSLSTWKDFQASPTDLLMPDVEKFHVPQNDFFLDYWDRVADRIYKIRNGFNLDGIKQAPPMFGLPLDPAALARSGALSAGSQGITALNIQVPHYRFSVILAKARDLAARAAQLGSALLSALEKKDAEQLSLLQTSHEAAVLQLTWDIKTSQKAEADASLAALEAGLESASARFQHYERLLQKGLSPAETAEIVCMSVAQVMHQISNGFRIASSASYLIPDVTVGYPPSISTTIGGSSLGSSLNGNAEFFSGLSDALSFGASLSSLLGGFERRAEEWDLQKNLAQHDQAQVEHQITAAQHQCAIAAQDLASLELNIKQNTAIERFLRDKFTNAELYHWLANKLAGLHFKTFQMAFDLALATEKAFQFELGSTDSFITSAYWDSLKKGLLAGDALLADLDRMEKTYLERNRRRFEIEKTLSLLTLAPEALLALKKTGHCRFALGERLFDQDFPGHYSRQIKRITLTFPAVVGPYQNICATLTQDAHYTLLEPEQEGVKFLLGQSRDNLHRSVRGGWRSTQEIALSRGLNDSGLFELGTYDDRYLPFEGTGAVSDWELEINPDSLNLERLSDVVIKVEYTALQGGGVFKDRVRELLKKQGTWTEACLFNLKNDFPAEWEKFRNEKSLNLTPTEAHFKKFSKKTNLNKAELKGFLLAFDLTEAGREALKDKRFELGTSNSNPKRPCDIQPFNDRFYQTLTLANPIKEPPWKEAWTLTAPPGFDSTHLNNLVWIAVYEGKTA